MTGIPTASADTGASRADDRPARWGAVYAMALCSFVLVASEFMPVSLLSPIAQPLQLTKGQAGQPIAIFAPHIARGELRLVLQDWATLGPGFHVYYSSRRQVPTGLRLLIDLVRELRPLG